MRPKLSLPMQVGVECSSTPACLVGFEFAEIGFLDLLLNYSGRWNAEQSHPIRGDLKQSRLRVEARKGHKVGVADPP